MESGGDGDHGKRAPRGGYMKDRVKVMVAGGCIGGLTAAIALRRAGFEVSVFERAAELREVGAGLLLAANA